MRTITDLMVGPVVRQGLFREDGPPDLDLRVVLRIPDGITIRIENRYDMRGW